MVFVTNGDTRERSDGRTYSTAFLISTSDVGLCDTFPPKIVRQKRGLPLHTRSSLRDDSALDVSAVALNCTTGRRVEPYKPNPFPEDDYDRFLWYWHETVDLVAALKSADQDGRYVLFLEDDVIPTVRFTSLTRWMAPRGQCETSDAPVCFVLEG